MTATATHDTKRGEDARARLLALAELSDDWAAAVQQWRTLNDGLLHQQPQRPSRAHQYMLYQALVGAWPHEGVSPDFVARMQAYAVKAAREGKEKTSWLVPDEDYEKALTDFIAKILDPQSSARFIEPFARFAERTSLMGALGSLAQVALKGTMPGVPDFYQGTEFWDLSLVDPDNRRPVDFAQRAAELNSAVKNPDWAALARGWKDGRIKLALTRDLITLRRRLGKLFTQGDYRPLAVSGPQQDDILAFARTNGSEAIITVVARRFARASDQGRRWPSGRDWQGSVPLQGFSSVRRIIPTMETLPPGDVPLAELFDVGPFAVLQADVADRRRAARTAKPI